MVRLRAAARQSGIPWRMCETNSFSGGGRPGVSDTLLGALWTLDFMAILAKYGCSGVNIETGVNQLGFVSSYSPIQDDGKVNNTAGVPYYGMLAFATAQAGCAQSIAMETPEGQPDLTAYAFGNGGKVRSLVLVNRTGAALDVSTAGLGVRNGMLFRLTGPAADSTTGVTFAGSAVDANCGCVGLRRVQAIDEGVAVGAPCRQRSQDARGQNGADGVEHNPVRGAGDSQRQTGERLDLLLEQEQPGVQGS